MQRSEKQKHHQAYDKKREEIIKAAEKRFIRHGLRKTTVEEIARDLRIGKASLYHYFPTKEDLFNETVKWQSAEYVQQLSHIFNDEGLTPLERVIAYFSLKRAFGGKFKLLEQLVSGYLNGTALPQEESLVSDLLKSETELLKLALPTILEQDKTSAAKQLAPVLPLFGLLLGNADQLLKLVSGGDEVVAAANNAFLDLLLRSLTLDPPTQLSKYQISSGS
jgi:AcrR family transcriptional regulator